jgi:hypothetical protein
MIFGIQVYRGNLIFLQIEDTFSIVLTSFRTWLNILDLEANEASAEQRKSGGACTCINSVPLFQLINILHIVLFTFVRSFVRSPDLFYLLTVGVEVVYFRLITLRNTPQSVGLLWTRDRPVAEPST